MKYTYFIDAAHGWIRVPLVELGHLDIVDDISAYSYISPGGRYAYLEEDMDATTFLKAYEDRYGRRPEMVEQYSERSRIRDYLPYNAGFVKWEYMGVQLSELRA